MQWTGENRDKVFARLGSLRYICELHMLFRNLGNTSLDFDLEPDSDTDGLSEGVPNETI